MLCNKSVTHTCGLACKIPLLQKDQSPPMKLLFLCTHNACRSILSEAMTRQIAGTRIAVASAGTEPAGAVHPLTLAALARHGYDTGDLHSKSIDAIRPCQPDVVITVCDRAAAESCPVWLGSAIRAHWGLPDPSALAGSADATEAFDRVMATIEQRIRRLLEQPIAGMETGQLAALLNAIGRQD
ncbi:MAG: arsenate reductase ArsC [Halioglobus sp.]